MPGGTSGGWARAPHGGRDLNFLLSELTELSGQGDVALPVVVTLAGLWADPAPAELADEAAAVAMFREQVAAGEMTAGGMAGPLDVTRVDIPVVVAEPLGAYPRELAGPAGRGRPKRPRRRGLSGRGWQRTALIVSASAATVAIGGVALANILSGPSGSVKTQVTDSSAAHSTPASTGPGRLSDGGGSPQGSTPAPVPASSSHPAMRSATSPAAAPSKASSPEPTRAPATASPPGPTVSPAATSAPAALCTRFFAFFTQPSSSGWVAEVQLYHELSQLAGAPGNVYSYCVTKVPAGTLPSGWPAAWPTTWPGWGAPAASQPAPGSSQGTWPTWP